MSLNHFRKLLIVEIDYLIASSIFRKIEQVTMVRRNILIVSNTGSGKTSYLNKLRKIFPYSEHAYPGADQVGTFDIPDLGKVSVSVANIVWTDIFDAAIIMVAEDPVKIQEFKNQIRDKCGDIPISVIFNKFELEETKKNYHQYVSEHPHEVVWCCSNNDNAIDGVKETFLEIISAE